MYFFVSQPFFGSKLVLNKESNGVLGNGSAWRNRIQLKNVHGTRRRVLFLAGLIGIGIILGSVALYAIDVNGVVSAWEFEFVDGRIILDAEDREHLKEQALEVTLEDEEIKELIAGKDYTTEVAMFGDFEFENIHECSTTERFAIKDDPLNTLNVVVTITFDDGSGYNIPVDWQNWTVVEPEFAQQVTPPEDEFRIIGLASTERTISFP